MRRAKRLLGFRTGWELGNSCKQLGYRGRKESRDGPIVALSGDWLHLLAYE